MAERSASGGAAAAAWKGEAIRSPLAAGRFLIEASQDEATRYEGFWLLGWDRQSSSCELVWLDAVSGALVRMRGRLDPSAGLFSFSGEGPAPGTGAPRKLRAGFRIGGGEGEDAQVLEVFEVVGTKARRLFRASYSPTAERDAPGGETPSGPFADAASAVKEAEAMQQVAMLSRALELYLMDERGLPGEGLPADASRNDFPRLFDALLGEPRPKGPGGRSSPYLPFGAANVRVWDEGKKAYRAARPAELKDPKVSKYILDPWGRPYVYRANKGKKAERWMRNAEGADIYSLGPNGKDDTAAGASGGDDIGNW